MQFLSLRFLTQFFNPKFIGFTIFCVILNLMEFKYLCYLFFKARVKLTSSARPPPMLPKPLAYPTGPCPAYEPLGKIQKYIRKGPVADDCTPGVVNSVGLH